MNTVRLVICIDNSEYPASLEKRKIYETLPDADAEKFGQIRVVDESGDDYLYPKKNFIDANLSAEVRAALIDRLGVDQERDGVTCLTNGCS